MEGIPPACGWPVRGPVLAMVASYVLCTMNAGSRMNTGDLRLTAQLSREMGSFWAQIGPILALFEADQGR
jgi:hypothetical protein